MTSSCCSGELIGSCGTFGVKLHCKFQCYRWWLNLPECRHCLDYGWWSWWALHITRKMFVYICWRMSWGLRRWFSPIRGCRRQMILVCPAGHGSVFSFGMGELGSLSGHGQFSTPWSDTTHRPGSPVCGYAIVNHAVSYYCLTWWLPSSPGINGQIGRNYVVWQKCSELGSKLEGEGRTDLLIPVWEGHQSEQAFRLLYGPWTLEPIDIKHNFGQLFRYAMEIFWKNRNHVSRVCTYLVRQGQNEDVPTWVNKLFY